MFERQPDIFIYFIYPYLFIKSIKLTNRAFLAAPSAGESRTAYCLHSINKLGDRNWLSSAMEHLWYGAHVTITCDDTCLGISGLGEIESVEMYVCCGDAPKHDLPSVNGYCVCVCMLFFGAWCLAPGALVVSDPPP